MVPAVRGGASRACTLLNLLTLLNVLTNSHHRYQPDVRGGASRAWTRSLTLMSLWKACTAQPPPVCQSHTCPDNNIFYFYFLKKNLRQQPAPVFPSHTCPGNNIFSNIIFKIKNLQCCHVLLVLPQILKSQSPSFFFYFFLLSKCSKIFFFLQCGQVILVRQLQQILKSQSPSFFFSIWRHCTGTFFFLRNFCRCVEGACYLLDNAPGIVV